jgi:cardiolipin synthase
MLSKDAHRARWLANGDQGHRDVTDHRGRPPEVRLEFYMIRPQGPAESLRAAMLSALRRGVQVSILYDAFGSEGLPVDFFDALQAQGARVASFNPARKLRLAFRDHRKLLVCDEQVAVLGGLNIGPEYAGDGVTRGWRDLALQIEGPVVASLANGFDDARAGADHAHGDPAVPTADSAQPVASAP